MRFSDAIRGTRAEKPVSLPGIVAASGAAFVTHVRPLTAAEESLVLERAHAFASGKGIKDPRAGHPLYDIAVMANTIAIGCVDPDSPKDERTPSFDGGVDQILSNLGPELVAYVYEQQEAWQSECSPRRKVKSDTELHELACSVVETEDSSLFLELEPATRAHLLLFLARQFVTSHADKSLSH